MLPIRKLYGESVTLSSTVPSLIAMEKKSHEARVYSASAFKFGIVPKTLGAFVYVPAAGETPESWSENFEPVLTDRSAATHMPLDGLDTGEFCYLGFTQMPRGVFFDIGTNVQDEAATLDVEYCYETAGAGHQKITGTISGAFTVGEEVSNGEEEEDEVTATVVYSGATYIIVKNVVGVGFAEDETLTGADSSETCSTVTAIDDEPIGTQYWADVANDTDGTDSSGDTLKVDGNYTWDLPASIAVPVNGVTAHWIRFTPSATLSATVDINAVVPMLPVADYGFVGAGEDWQFEFHKNEVGGIEALSLAATPTLNVSWVQF